MRKTPVRRLKVFQAPFGFYDTIVAVPSRAAALRAWETRQNLFAFGQAHEVEDPEAIAAALSQPGVVLKRAVGSNAPFAKEATSLPILPDAPERPALKPAAKPVAPSRPRAQPADRSALTKAEASLSAIDRARRAEEAAFRRQQEELDAARSAAQAFYVQRRRAATTAVVEARSVYRKAGGTD
ncbi:hypothetical protein [Brevundimonas sp.]|uniref:hypothetical protein n=1 Tax=Brevundimonas sp. TaxID=1871086 RepID=UPI00356A73E8